MWMEDSTTETIRARVDKKIEEDPGHAMEAVSALWKIANEDDNAASKLHDTEAPPNVSISWSRLTSRVIRGCFID